MAGATEACLTFLIMGLHRSYCKSMRTRSGFEQVHDGSGLRTSHGVPTAPDLPGGMPRTVQYESLRTPKQTHRKGKKGFLFSPLNTAPLKIVDTATLIRLSL
jgi:hypothetical protein